RIVILLDLEARGGYILLAGYGWTWEDYLEWLQTGSPAPKEAAALLPTHRAIDKCNGDKLFNAVTGKYIYVLTMSKLDLKPGVGDSGTTDPALGAHEFDEDTIVDLEAFPGENWLFEEWQGDVVGSTVLIDGDKEVTAVFTPIEHLLEIINYFPQGGNVDVAAGNVALVNLPMVPQGAELILTAVPSKNWRFVSWELPYDHSTKNPEYFTMDAPAILKVYFAPIEGKYPLTVGKIGTGEGNTTPVPGIYKFNPGAEVPLTASAASGSRFDRWFVDGLGQTEGAESIVVTIDATTTAMANFIKLWTLNVDKVGEGTTSLESGIYDDGTRLTLVATPADGWRFDKWVINDEEFLTEEVADYPIVEDTLAKAYFIKQYTLTVNVLGEGTTDPAPGSYILDMGTEKTLTAEATAGWGFEKWIVNGNETTDNPKEVLMDADREATAVFTQLKPGVELDSPEYACGTKKFTVLAFVTYADDAEFEFEDGTTTIIEVVEINGTVIYEVEIEAPSVPGPIPLIKALTVTASNEVGETVVRRDISILKDDNQEPTIGEFYANPDKVACEDETTLLFFDFFCDPCKDDVDFRDFEMNERIEVSHGYVDWDTLDAAPYIEGGRCGYSGKVEWVFEDIDCETVMATVTIRDYCGNESQSGLDNGPLGPVDNVDPKLISFEQIGGFDCDDPEIVFEFSIEENCLCEIELVSNCACDWEYELSDPATKLGENGRIITTYTATVTMLAREDCTDYSFKLLFADCCRHDGESEWITVNKDLRAPRIMMHGFLSSDLYTPSLNTIGDMVISVIGIINPITKEFLDIDLFEVVLPINLNDILGSFLPVMDNIDLVPMDQASIIYAELEDLISMVEDYLMPCNAGQGYYTWMVWDDCLKETEIIYSDTICNTGKKVEEATQPGYLVGYQRVELCGLDCETIRATLTAYDECGNSSTSTIMVLIDNVGGIEALDDFEQTDQNTAITVSASDGVLINDVDPSGKPLSVVKVNGMAPNIGVAVYGTSGGEFVVNPDGSYFFDPLDDFIYLAAGESITTSIDYTITDCHVNCSLAEATLEIEVFGLNDKPVVIEEIPNQEHLDDKVITLNLSNYFGDPDAGDVLTFDATGLPAGLTIDASTGVISGTIDNSASQGGPNGDGVYTVTVTVTDPHGETSSQIFTWTVTNPSPVAIDDFGETDQDTVLTVDATNGVLENDYDPDGDDLVVTETTNGTDTVAAGTPIAGTNGGTFTINPDGSYTFDPGKDFVYLPKDATTTTSITYTISDGEGGTDTAVLTITVTGLNDAPVSTAIEN
ncbi:MAG: cadherin-like domain-containing protein, partial [Thermotogaceae bacterium]|nr:cadherin-like domain-containing protein [Thermotogaceae bacterium]